MTDFLSFDASFPGINIRYEITLMKAFLSEVWAGIEHSREKYIKAEELKYQGDPIYERQHIYAISEEAFERFALQPFTVSIAALFESSMKRLLGYGQIKENKQLGLKDVNGKSPLDLYLKYAQLVLGYEIEISHKERSAISDLTKVRNCVAHANGDPYALDANKLEDLKDMERRGVGISIEYYSLSVRVDFLESSLATVDGVLDRIICYMEEKYNLGFPQAPAYILDKKNI